MKTAMQELLEFVKYKINNDPATEYGRVYSEVFRQVKSEIEDRYLEAEKEQIIEVYNEGKWAVKCNNHESTEDFYNRTYKSDE